MQLTIWSQSANIVIKCSKIMSLKTGHSREEALDRRPRCYSSFCFHHDDSWEPHRSIGQRRLEHLTLSPAGGGCETCECPWYAKNHSFRYINEPTDAPKMRFFGAYVCEQTDMCECACNSNSHFAEIRATEHIPECERPKGCTSTHWNTSPT